jgi:hypothetical protein
MVVEAEDIIIGTTIMTVGKIAIIIQMLQRHCL